MSFHEVPMNPTAAAAAERVTIAIYRFTTYSRLSINIGSAVAARLGWKAFERVAVAYGEGDDFGKVRLWRADSGRQLTPNANGRHLRVRLPTWQAKPLPRAAKEVKHQVVAGDQLELELPWWARRVEDEG